MKLSIILPTYNEKDNLPIIVWLIFKHLKNTDIDFEIIIIDDGSPDDTLQVALRLQDVFGMDRIIVLDRGKKLGLGTAYKAGLDLSHGDYIVLMDADLSHHPKFIPQFASMMKNGNYDIVTGTRYAQGGGVAGWNFMRKFISCGANVFAQMALGPTVSDLTGSFRLYKRSVLEKLITRTTSKGYAFQMEIIVLAEFLGHKVGEIPISFVDRFYGDSKMGFDEIIKFVYGICDLLVRY